MNKENIGYDIIFPIGEKNPFGEYFIGESYLNMLTTEGMGIGNVTFSPGCRNNWHIHHATSGGGQILLCTGGFGWYQEEGKEAVPLKKGDVVVIPPNVKHWHGARENSWFTHIAVEVPGQDSSTEWCSPVSDEEYEKLN